MSSKADPSAELISELRAFINSGSSMGALDERKVRLVVENMRESFERIQSIESNPYADPAQPYYASSAKYYRAKYLRDKRCVLSYLLWRQEQIAEAWWRTRDNLLDASLSAAEAEYLEEFNNTMVEYMTSFAVPVDLRAFLWRPPSVQQMEVRGLADYVFVSPVTGNTISIYTGEQVLLSFEEAEPLLQQGVVELVRG